MITLENVSKSYAKGQPALNDVSLHIDKGEFVFIVGNSGSGKSTLIKLLLKELEPTSGTIIVNDQNLGKMKRRKVPKYRRGVGVVFQDFRLLKDRNVYENVAFAQRVIERPNRVIKKRVPEILTLVGLAEKYKSFPRELSGGEQQRVALARALVNRPNILLADEPTGNLDPKNSLEIMKLLEEINERGTTVLVVTHNREIVNSFRKRVITMRKGVIVSDEEEGGYLEDKYNRLQCQTGNQKYMEKYHVLRGFHSHYDSMYLLIWSVLLAVDQLSVYCKECRGRRCGYRSF